MSLLQSLPDRRADGDPDGLAVADGRQSLTNWQFLDRIRANSQHLRKLGVGVGDVVALKLVNRVEFVTLLFAAWRIGAAVTPINPSLTNAEVARQLGDSGARLLICDDDATAHDDVVTVDVDTLQTEPAQSDSEPHRDSTALALLIYTSGTTGAPKGVMLEHANLDAMAHMGCRAMQIEPDDRCLLILPLFHVNGIVVSVVTPLLAGGSVVIADRFDPRTFFDVVERERPTYFSAVPTIYTMLAVLPVDLTPDTSSVRFAHLRCRARSDGTTDPVRGSLRVPAHRGLRTVGGHVRLHNQPDRGTTRRHRREGIPRAANSHHRHERRRGAHRGRR